MPIYDYEFELGLTAMLLANIEDSSLFGVPPQPWVFRHGAERYVAGTGHSYYDGYPQTEWTFEYFPLLAWTNLMALFNGAESIDVVFSTKEGEDEYTTYTGILHRPVIGESVERTVGGWSNVVLKFTHLEEY